MCEEEGGGGRTPKSCLGRGKDAQGAVWVRGRGGGKKKEGGRMTEGCVGGGGRKEERT